MNNEQDDIDNDDNLFNFDPYDILSSSRRRAQVQVVPTGTMNAEASVPSHDTPFMSRELDEQVHNRTDKGKQVSMPMPIRPSANTYDLFDVPPLHAGTGRDHASSIQSNFSSFASSSYAFSSLGSSTGTYGSFPSPSLSGILGLGSLDETLSAPLTSDLSGKGKSREMAPTLPPLILGLNDLGEDDSWLIFNTGSCSTRSETTSNTSPHIGAISSTTPSSPTMREGSSNSSGENLGAPPRCRSLSSFSLDSATSSTTVNMESKSRTSSYLARKFILGRKTDESGARPPSPNGISAATSSTVDSSEVPTVAATGDAPRQWYTAQRTIQTNALVTRAPPPIPILALETAMAYTAPRGTLKHKGRSHSTPLPFSALDYVPITSTDIFEPLPLFTKNYFDDIISRELRLRILASLVQVHIDSHRRMVEGGRWSVNRASLSRNRWVGRDKGVKELIRLSRVSKSWRSLVFDGQLWADFDLHSFPGLPRDIMRLIAESAGPFIKSLNFTGLTDLDSDEFLDIASNLCLVAPLESLSYTQLTAVNMQGCTGLTTRALHHLLIRSRSLETLNLRGLGAATNTTCEILATYCPALTSLNMNRCMNMDAEGIFSMAAAALARREHLQLKELRLCGLKHTSDSMMAALGKAAPHLEVLDLSYARRLHNSALEAFVACEDGAVSDIGVDTVVVSARDLGREVNDISYFRRRVTRLRHLNLSFCLLLTDTACTNLAYSLPRLEYLEMAGIGSELKSPGLVRLFEHTPFIKRVDLEDALDVGDLVLAALTPVPEDATVATRQGAPSLLPPPPGHALQYLNVSSSNNIHEHGLVSLVRGCPKLTTLEADGTRMSGSVLREFVRLSKERQICNAKIVGVDCRGIGENVVKELSGSTRPRQGWRSYAARRLYYLDERDGNEEALKIGQDECDENRVVVKTFYSWQTVDAVKASREKRKKAVGSGSSRRAGNGSSAVDWDEAGGGRTRWWSPGGRRGPGSGSASPMALTDVNEGCRAM